MSAHWCTAFAEIFFAVRVRTVAATCKERKVFAITVRLDQLPANLTLNLFQMKWRQVHLRRVCSHSEGET